MTADVLVVGYGPVGQVLSIMLARQGWSVTVVERWENPYPMPRATVFDGETARTLACLGLDPAFAGIGETVDAYDWRNAAGQTLLRMDFAPVGASGWPDATAFHQPALEAALAARATELEERGLLRVLRGHSAEAVTESADGGVTLAAVTADGERLTLDGSWLVGCDGANSVVRGWLGGAVTDLGFSHDWLLCDVILDRPRVFEPANAQICDPVRPTTVVGSGPGRRRWEFMRLPGETVEELDRPETAWLLLGRSGVTPQDATLARHTVYTFRAAVADTWRRGRLLLAGDAAHSMPPFAGAGMCSGIRDALNLSWKLDRVLRGGSDERLLDTYEAERRSHVLRTIELSVQLGRIVCVTDEEEAARRDAALLAGKTPGRPLAQPLREGLLHRTVGTVAALPTGALIPQGRVARDRESGPFDQVVGTGFVFLTTEDPAGVLNAEQTAFLAAIGAHVIRVVAEDSARQASGDVVDLDKVYLPFLAGARARFALVRPDFHVFGVGRNARELTMLLAELKAGLAVLAPEPEVDHPARH